MRLQCEDSPSSSSVDFPCMAELYGALSAMRRNSLADVESPCSTMENNDSMIFASCCMSVGASFSSPEQAVLIPFRPQPHPTLLSAEACAPSTAGAPPFPVSVAFHPSLQNCSPIAWMRRKCHGTDSFHSGSGGVFGKASPAARRCLPSASSPNHGTSLSPGATDFSGGDTPSPFAAAVSPFRPARARPLDFAVRSRLAAASAAASPPPSEFMHSSGDGSCDSEAGGAAHSGGEVLEGWNVAGGLAKAVEEGGGGNRCSQEGEGGAGADFGDRHQDKGGGVGEDGTTATLDGEPPARRRRRRRGPAR